ncbi:hypothetical protein NLJ89_g5375 [Agrocybe chaxingu]|uniref:F-box domain-containing protein n=1 Tax=Agrocybe chaxingu TaxID=84603 RepID=A0A9W8K0Q7_9AGAR|nr:hypothetical protein NLJ89_g5375 [Agrocybe chaxingu]
MITSFPRVLPLDTANTAHRRPIRIRALPRQNLLKRAITNDLRLHNETTPAFNGLLPHDIISYIFSICVLQLDMHPTLLCMVCKMWHQIAITTPYLWTTVRINLTLAEDYPGRYSGYISRTLKRSHDLSLCVYIFDDGIPLPTTELPFQGPRTPLPLAHTIKQHISRFQYLKVTTSRPSLPQLSIGGLHMYSDLRTLHIEGNPERVPQIKIDAYFAYFLRNVHISRTSLYFLKINWRRVTKLVVEHVAEEEVVEILKNAPQLVSCTLKDLVPSRHTMAGFLNLKLSVPRLQFVHLRIRSEFMEILGWKFTFPALTEMVYEGPRTPPPFTREDAPLLPIFVACQNNGRMKRLTLMNCNVRPEWMEYVSALISSNTFKVHLDDSVLWGQENLASSSRRTP